MGRYLNLQEIQDEDWLMSRARELKDDAIQTLTYLHQWSSNDTTTDDSSKDNVPASFSKALLGGKQFKIEFKLPSSTKKGREGEEIGEECCCSQFGTCSTKTEGGRKKCSI